MKNILKDLLIFTTILIYFIYCINYNAYIQEQTIYSINIWITKIIPTLFPTFLIVDLIYNSNIPYYFNKIFHFDFIYLLSIISGSPTNAHILNKYNEDITKSLSVTKYTSLLFTYTFLKNIYNVKLAILLILTNILSNIILTIFLKPKPNPIIKKNLNIFNTIIQSISHNINTLIIILGTLIFFNTLPTNLIPNLYIKSFLLSILEVTTSLNNLLLIDIPLNIKILFTIITISTCGLCIETQIKSIINDTSINNYKYLKYRLIHLIIYMFLTIIGLTLFN
ncbi:MAG TPA: hypothetical protein IAC02_02340 [Candidatus Coprovivens excrementavium]|nr:hypothetical protein [Candidatus Coprovivens excrementavium]